MTKYRPAEQKVKRTAQVFLFRFIGLRRQTMISGFVIILGYIFIGATLKYKMVIIPALSFIFLIGLPYGVTVVISFVNPKEKLDGSKIGKAVTLINGGNSIGILVIPYQCWCVIFVQVFSLFWYFLTF